MMARILESFICVIIAIVIGIMLCKKFEIIKLLFITVKGKIFYIINLISRTYLKELDRLRLNTNRANNFGYRALGPTDDAENTDVYLDSLEWALKKDNVKNIAVSAPYGAGKSSILLSFFKKHPSIKYINISFAKFKDATNKNDNNYKFRGEKSGIVFTKYISFENAKDKRVIESDYEIMLEEAILEQLFYKVKKRRIPLSRYQKINKNSWAKNIVSFLTACIVVIVAFYIWKPNDCISLINEHVELFSDLQLGKKIMFLGIAAVAVFVSSYFYRRCLSVIGNIEIGIKGLVSVKAERDEKKSPFKEYLDEIVYFFESTDYQVVVFEDMDRFNNPRVFVKLRELNNILNGYENIKRKIVFIYALRDDIFSKGDRTKFFDFMVPVVPYVNRINGFANVKNRFKNIEDIDNDPSLREICISILPYLDDMRIVNNIGNEYIVYSRTILANNSALIKSQMFALIIIKNFYPEAFADIQKNGGLIQKIVDIRKKKLSDKWQVSKSELEKAEKKLKRAKESVAFNSSILKQAIMYSLEKELGKIKEIEIDDEYKTIPEILSDDVLFEKLITKKDVDVRYIYTYSTYNRDELGTIENVNTRVIDGKKYIEYWDDLKYRHGIERKSIEDDINKYRKLCEEIDCIGFSEGIRLISSEQEIDRIRRKYPVLVLFLEVGYIDMNYNDYVNYFREGILSESEHNFVLSVRGRNGNINWNVGISHCELLMDNLIPSDFNNSEILNFDLLRELVRVNALEDKLNRVLTVIKNRNDIRFIVAYLKDTENKLEEGLFELKYLRYWPGFLKDIGDSNLTDTEKGYLYNSVIANANVDDIRIANNLLVNDRKLDYLFNNEIDFGQLVSNTYLEKIIKILVDNTVYFENVGGLDVDKKVRLELFKNNLFISNKVNFQTYIRDNCDIEKYDIYKNRLITTIKEIGDSDVQEYVNDDIRYWGDVLVDESDKDEDIKIVVEYYTSIIMLSGPNEDIIKEYPIEKIIDNQNTDTGDIIGWNVEDYNSKWQTIIDTYISKGKFACSWNNVASYSFSFDFDDIILDYIEEHIEELETTDCDFEDFFKSLISDEPREKTIRSVIINHGDLGIDSIKDTSSNVCKELIKSHYFAFDKSEYDIVVEEYHDLLPLYIETYWDNLKEIIDHKEFSSEDLDVIVGSNISEDMKNVCISTFEEDEIGDSTYEYALSHEIKSENIAYILWDNSDEDEKLTVLINYFDYMTYKLSDRFGELSPEYRKLAKTGKRHYETMENNETNLKLAKLLKKCGYISNYDTKENGKLIFRVR